MQKLTVREHSFLTENLLKTLAQNRIMTISDFLQEDTEKLSIISKLSLPELLEIRNHILVRYSAPLVNGYTLFLKSLSNRKYVPTHISNLDSALEGGIPIGCITELCGLAGTGKTQICFHIAINCAKELNASVLYIDTKGDFSAKRIQMILETWGCTHKEMNDIMLKIRVVHIWNLEDAIQLLAQVKHGKIINNLGLIILDSLPCLMFQYLGDNNKIGLKLLNELVNNIRYISKELRVCAVCVNIQTRWVESDIPDIDGKDNIYYEHSTSVTKEPIAEKRNRCLGKYWQHIPSVILITEKFQTDGNNYLMKVQVFKSQLPKQSQQCILNPNVLGINTSQ